MDMSDSDSEGWETVTATADNGGTGDGDLAIKSLDEVETMADVERVVSRHAKRKQRQTDDLTAMDGGGDDDEGEEEYDSEGNDSESDSEGELLGDDEDDYKKKKKKKNSKTKGKGKKRKERPPLLQRVKLVSVAWWGDVERDVSLVRMSIKDPRTSALWKDAFGALADEPTTTTPSRDAMDLMHVLGGSTLHNDTGLDGDSDTESEAAAAAAAASPAHPPSYFSFEQWFAETHGSEFGMVNTTLLDTTFPDTMLKADLQGLKTKDEFFFLLRSTDAYGAPMLVRNPFVEMLVVVQPTGAFGTKIKKRVYNVVGVLAARTRTDGRGVTVGQVMEVFCHAKWQQWSGNADWVRQLLEPVFHRYRMAPPPKLSAWTRNMLSSADMPYLPQAIKDVVRGTYLSQRYYDLWPYFRMNPKALRWIQGFSRLKDDYVCELIKRALALDPLVFLTPETVATNVARPTEGTVWTDESTTGTIVLRYKVARDFVWPGNARMQANYIGEARARLNLMSGAGVWQQKAKFFSSNTVWTGVIKACRREVRDARYLASGRRYVALGPRETNGTLLVKVLSLADAVRKEYEMNQEEPSPFFGDLMVVGARMLDDLCHNAVLKQRDDDGDVTPVGKSPSLHESVQVHAQARQMNGLTTQFNQYIESEFTRLCKDGVVQALLVLQCAFLMTNGLVRDGPLYPELDDLYAAKWPVMHLCATTDLVAVARKAFGRVPSHTFGLVCDAVMSDAPLNHVVVHGLTQLRLWEYAMLMAKLTKQTIAQRPLFVLYPVTVGAVNTDDMMRVGWKRVEDDMIRLRVSDERVDKRLERDRKVAAPLLLSDADFYGGGGGGGHDGVAVPAKGEVGGGRTLIQDTNLQDKLCEYDVTRGVAIARRSAVVPELQPLNDADLSLLFLLLEKQATSRRERWHIVTVSPMKRVVDTVLPMYRRVVMREPMTERKQMWLARPTAVYVGDWLYFRASVCPPLDFPGTRTLGNAEQVDQLALLVSPELRKELPDHQAKLDRCRGRVLEVRWSPTYDVFVTSKNKLEHLRHQDRFEIRGERHLPEARARESASRKRRRASTSSHKPLPNVETFKQTEVGFLHHKAHYALVEMMNRSRVWVPLGGPECEYEITNCTVTPVRDYQHCGVDTVLCLGARAPLNCEYWATKSVVVADMEKK